MSNRKPKRYRKNKSPYQGPNRLPVKPVPKEDNGEYETGNFGRDKKGKPRMPIKDDRLNAKIGFPTSAFWTAIFTGVLCIFTYLLYSVSERANKINAATQRATVNIIGPNWTRIMNSDGKTAAGFKVNIVWTNSGHTPAMAGTSEYNMSLGDIRPDASLNFDDLNQNPRIPYVLGPGGGLTIPEVTLTMNDIDDVVQRKKHLFFWGWTVYTDSIPDSPKRLTEFCSDVTNLVWTKPNLTDPDENVNWISPPCAVHNCYDEQCEDYSKRTK